MSTVHDQAMAPFTAYARLLADLYKLILGLYGEIEHRPCRRCGSGCTMVRGWTMGRCSRLRASMPSLMKSWTSYASRRVLSASVQISNISRNSARLQGYLGTCMALESWYTFCCPMVCKSEHNHLIYLAVALN